MSLHADELPDVLTVTPLSAPPDVSLRPPGSKSITNRALLCAALAPGRSTLTGVLFADDTHAILGAVRALGATLTVDEAAYTVVVDGVGTPDEVQERVRAAVAARIAEGAERG